MELVGSPFHTNVGLHPYALLSVARSIDRNTGQAERRAVCCEQQISGCGPRSAEHCAVVGGTRYQRRRLSEQVTAEGRRDCPELIAHAV
jgi:hypothetical protein